MILVGNKSDLAQQREVRKETALSRATEVAVFDERGIDFEEEECIYTFIIDAIDLISSLLHILTVGHPVL